MNIPLAKKHYTLDEFLAIEEELEEKHEYHGGEIIPKFRDVWSTGSHSLISQRTGTVLTNLLDNANKNCSVYNNDLKIYMASINKAVYPDASVVCGDTQYYDKNETIATNPLLIVEVLSKSTKNYDRSTKFEYYRTLPSFKEYVIIFQTIPKIQTWYKHDENLWRISSAFGLDSSIELLSLGITIDLKDVYRRVKGLKDEDDLSAY